MPPSVRHNNGFSWLLAMLAIVALIAASGAVGWRMGQALGHQSSPGAPNVVGSLDTGALSAKLNPAIVDVNSVLGNGHAEGTGMILTSNGEVLTNNHVIAGSSSIQVVIAGLGSKNAQLIAADPSMDVALLQIQGVSGLSTVILSSGGVKVGEQVVSLGNAYGRGGAPAVSVGTVNALNQEITAGDTGGTSESLSGMIELIADIVPGDSGGPVVNANGEVVGMITAGDGNGSAGASTTAYAIPSKNLTRVIDLVHSGATSSEILRDKVGLLGVEVNDVSASGANKLGVSGGALVTGVQAGSGAAKGGIKIGMVIVGVEGAIVSDTNTLSVAAKSHREGETVSVEVVDGGGSHRLSVTLGGVNP